MREFDGRRGFTRRELFAAVRRKDSLAGADLREVDALVIDLADMDLRGADLSGRHLPMAVGGRFYPGGVTEVRLLSKRRARFRRSALDRANLSRLLGARGDFRGASAREARFTQADLTDADFRGADLTGADFTDAALDGTRFDGGVWDDTTIWPAGFTP